MEQLTNPLSTLNLMKRKTFIVRHSKVHFLRRNQTIAGIGYGERVQKVQTWKQSLETLDTLICL